MLTREENELVTRVGPGTPMGEAMRRYWMPALLANQLAKPDCPPVRVRLLGEDLVAFRDTQGRVGLVEEYCPHRRASLFLGRNEENGLRCVYHGWKYDVEGHCVDMPNEPPETNFQEKIHLTAYPTIESAGMVWTYLGPADKRPPFREFAFHAIPREQWIATKVPLYCNYLQSMDGNVDSFHSSYLHRSLQDRESDAEGTDRPGYASWGMSVLAKATGRAGKIEVQPTEYGFRYASLRPTPGGNTLVRMTVFVMPN